jgi:nucleoside-diphosphate-sugar epimerase
MAHFLVTGAAGFIGSRVSEIFEELTGKQAQVEHHPAHRVDISKAKRLLGWEPHMSLVDWMCHVVEWYRTERAWAKEVATS